MKAAIEASRAKVDAIRAAQKAGTVTERFDAEQLLILVLTMAAMWSSQSTEIASLAAPAAQRDYRRRTVVEAVRWLIEP